jgi:hypothetical protein
MARSVVTGSTVYVLGGMSLVSGNLTRLGSIEAATINQDGSLTTFSPVSTVALSVPRNNFPTVVVGNLIYVLGGDTDTPTDANSIEKATINPDGSISTFSRLSGITLAAQLTGHSGVVSGGSIFVLGGISGASAMNTVERATINADGSISTFANVSGVTLVNPEFDLSLVTIGNSLYAIGSDQGGPPGDVEVATVNPDGTLTSFSMATGVTLAFTRNGHTNTMLDNSLYVVGGYLSSAPVNSIDQATLP